MKKSIILFFVILSCLLLIFASNKNIRHSQRTSIQGEQAAKNTSNSMKPDLNFGKFPLYFTANIGQVDGKVKFYTRASRYTLWLTKEGLIFDSTRAENTRSSIQESEIRITLPGRGRGGLESYKFSRDVSRLMFIGANKNPEIVSLRETKLKANYFIGSDRSKWKCDVPTSLAVLYKNLYKNIDLKVYGIEKQIEYDWIVKPGGNPADIRFEYKNVKKIWIDENGNLVIKTDFGELFHKKPVSYQASKAIRHKGNKAIREIVEVTFKKIAKDTYGFWVGTYDKSRELIIDPVVLAYSTYLGGGSYEHGLGITVDSNGYAYVTGHTNSTDFPCLDQDLTDRGGCDVFISKIDTSQSGSSSLVYSVYLGGGAFDNGHGIVVDSSGIIYVSGYTESSDFPTQNQYQLHRGGRDAFITKIDPNQNGIASLIFSTYLGGGDWDHSVGIAIDSSGFVYIAGSTNSNDFPVLNQYQPDQAGSDAFISKLDTTQSGAASLLYSTYLGGGNKDYCNGMSLGNSDIIYVTGTTYSNNFPLRNQYQTTPPSGEDYDSFVAKIDTTQNGAPCLLYSTYLGGESGDEGYGIAVDSNGITYVAGHTMSSNFPTRNAYQESNAGYSDACLTKIDTNKVGNSSLLYSTFLGGTIDGRAYAIAVDNSGCAYVTGDTSSMDFPLKDEYQPDQGNIDAFVTKIDTTGNGAASLVFSSYLGGGGHDYGYALALDSKGNAYVTGRTASYDFPVLNQYQVNSDDFWDDVFITKLVYRNLEILAPNGDEILEVGAVQDITWSSSGINGNIKIEYSIDNGANWSEIISTTDDDGSYSWIVPDIVSNQCKIKITDIDGGLSDTSDNTFSIVPVPVLSLISPDGNENWRVGSTYDITWTSEGNIGNLKIEYSIDDGVNWVEIVSSTENDGVYSWTIPDAVSDQCRVRLSETDGSPSAASSNTFSIVPIPSIIVTAPNFGEHLGVGSVFYITWYTTDLPGNVDIEYSTDNGSNWAYIVNSTENDGTHPWQVPNLISSACLVRVSETNGTIADISDCTFSIVTGSVVPPFSLTCTTTVPDHAQVGEEVQFIADFSISGNAGSLFAADTIVGNMRYVPLTGSLGFLQGAPDTDPGHSTGGWDAQFSHVLTKNIAVMETEITRQMWADLKAVQSTLPDDPSSLSSSYYLTQPVNYVSWYETAIFANLLSLQNGFTPCYYTDSSKTIIIDSTNYDNNDTIFCDFSANGYRLPTEGEWEYFTRAGTTTPFWIDEPNFTTETLYTCTQGDLPSLETAAVFCANRELQISIPATKLANPWNLYDAHGNVSEWCWDLFGATYPAGTVTDYTGASTGTHRIMRGGSYVQDALRCRSANREGPAPGYPNFYYGFRLVRSISAPTTSYEWRFGDMAKAYERTAGHIYTSSSFYGWQLIVNHDGQLCQKSGMIHITPENSITITSPNGGESYEIGTLQEINWTNVGIFDYVKIEYSTDSGNNWWEIVSSTDNDGSYYWTIPAVISSNCLIKISEIDGDAVDNSDNEFSIIAPLGTITVTSPNGGEAYEVSTSQAITWTTTGIVGNVRIEVSYDNGSSWLEWVYSTENDGYFPWSPNQVSSQCLIRISETADGFPVDTSDNVFSILPLGSTVTVTSPNGGEYWNAGSTQNITWDAPGLLSSLKIEYSTDNGATWKIITSSTPDDGSHPWIIPDIVSNQCLVRISETDGDPTDTSDSTFTLYSDHPFINITFPNGGETIEGLSLQNITWTFHDVIDYVKIEYSTDGDSNWTEIASNVINVGSYPWSVPNGLLFNCYVRVSTMSGTVEDSSDSGFMVSFTDWRIPEIERLALIDLYNSTNGDNWTNNSGWKTPPLHTDGFAMPGTENDWYGVVVIGNWYVHTLNLRENNLTGTLPFSIGNFANIIDIDFYSNNIGGNIPASIGDLSSLRYLSLVKNQLTGTIPDSIGNITNLVSLNLHENQLSNGIPASIGNLSNLLTLSLAGNNLGGTIPPEIGNLSNLQILNLYKNLLGGNIPSEIGSLSNLQFLILDENYFTGSIPVSIGNLSNLGTLTLNDNSLTGNIPVEFSNLGNLSSLAVRGNKLSGEIPADLTNLTSLNEGSADIGYNSLYTDDDTLRTFLGSKDPDWEETQTIAPTNVTVTPLSGSSVEVNWTPIMYTVDTGGYRVYYGTTSGGPYTLYGTTLDKTASSMIVTGLTPTTNYYFVVQTRTDAHDNNRNLLDSEYSEEVSLTTPPISSIEITYPNGGEYLEVGSVPNITWSTTGIVGNVKIEYSTTGVSGTYAAIVGSAPNTGVYSGWTVPAEISSDCFIKVSEVDGSPVDFSDSAFSIVQPLTISGFVTSGGTGLENVVMNGLPGNPETDASGSYTAVVNYGWSGTVTPTLTGYTFTEPSTTYTSVISDQSTDYTATPIAFTISGTITHGGTGLENVVMNGLPGSPVTDAGGFYTASVNYGWSGTATPTLNNFTFTPPSTTYTSVTADQTTDYTAALTNPISASERAALIELYNSTNGDSWTNSTGWKTEPVYSDGFAMPGTEESWFGVSVESTNHVSSITLGSNNLIGTIPVSIGDLIYLTELHLYTNQLSGIIPVELFSLTGLEIIDMSNNQLSGVIPIEIGNLMNLRFLYLYINQLSGEIPLSIGNCTALIRLYLDDNQLTGRVPDEICNLINLERFDFSGNSIIGNIPNCITNLTALADSFNNIGYNGLFTDDDNVRTFLDNKAPDWEETQTIAPFDVTAVPFSTTSIQVSWTPIRYTADPGGYDVYYSTSTGGPYTYFDTTVDKTVSSMTVNGLTPAATYYFVIQARTEPHGSNLNTVISDNSEEVSAVTFSDSPSITVTSPNGGEHWEMNSTQNITWTTGGTVGNIKIDYSIDNGTTWSNITASTNNSGSYSWTVPGSHSNQCLIKISTIDGNIYDISNSTFSIVDFAELSTPGSQGMMVEQTADGGYILTGASDTNSNGGFDCLVLKLDASGNETWRKNFGGVYDDKAMSIQQTTDSGYILAGWSKSFVSGIPDSDIDFYAIKLNSAGAEKRSKNFGGTSPDSCHSARETLDGGYIFAGTSESFTNGGKDILVYKLNSGGTLQWKRNFGGSQDEQACTIRQTLDGNFIIGGSSESFSNGQSDFILYKIDTNGSEIWHKNYGSTGLEILTSVEQTPDGGYALLGYTDHATNGGIDFMVYKVNANGVESVHNNYGGALNDWGFSLYPTSDGGYIFAGTTEFYTNGGKDFLVYKLNSKGKQEWRRNFGGTEDDYAFSVKQTADGGFVVAGTTLSFVHTPGETDILIYKLDAAGNEVWHNNFGN